jgi:hypothetical protein
MLVHIADEKRRGARLGALRLAAFGALTVTGWIAVRSGSPFDRSWGAIALAALIAFAIGVVLSRRSRARLQWSRDRLTIAEEGLARVRRDWNAIPLREWDAPDGTHPYAADLDLFGSGSLSQLLPPVSRAPGRGTLASWLLAPAEQAVIVERQEAVRELVPRVDLREEMAVQGMYATIEPDWLEGLRAWSATSPATRWTPRRMQLAAGLLGATTCALFVADLADMSRGPLWLLSALVAAVASGFATRRLKVASAHAYGHLTTLRAFGSIISRVQGEALRAGMLQRAKRDLTEGPHAALSSFARLARLVEYSEARRSPLPHFVLNALLLWDVHVLAGFDRWQATRGGSVGRWLGAIGTVEALAALATLAHDNPDWVFPEVTDESERIEARALGHPLLPPDRCVRNHVELGPRGTLLVISGSNMSGKSTLLRSIGLGVVMAQAGSVVCAAGMRCPGLAVQTSIHIEDSLRRGVSQFMAELLRIKRIVDAAEASAGGATVLYLLDEVLHGTNSMERAIATERIMRHLMALGAVGAVTTHDLALFESEALAEAVRHVHFTEHFEARDSGRLMTFDYMLRPGKATSRNALALLELVGLPSDSHLRGH